ncbi:MAG: ATP-binding protein [Janthinobacterium lividum]
MLFLSTSLNGGFGEDTPVATQLASNGQRKLLQQLLASNPYPMFVQNEQAGVVLTNAPYDELPGPITGQLVAASSTPGPTGPETVVCPLPGEPTRWYQLVRQQVTGPTGTHYQVITACDTTAPNQAREAAQTVAKAQEAFLTTMSHEIRTPLNGIIGLTRLLQQTARPTGQEDYLDHLLTCAESLRVVVDGILDFTKLEAGRLELENRPFDVAAAMQRAANTVAPSTRAKSLALRVSLPTDALPVVAGDVHRLEQVLLNLLSNAIKFTAAGEVSVSVEPVRYDQGQVQLRFCVADTGIGMEADQLEKVFQRFTQASSTTSRLYGGTGLGLAICRRLVELQGGRIWLESQPGRGSQFFFELPYAVSEQLPAPDETCTPVVPGLLRGLRVLLVEDNPINILLATTLLQAWHTSADLASDGEQALALARHTPYDVVLLDIQLPGLNGFEVAARLRAEPGPNQAVPLLALTADVLQEDAAYKAAGFSDWLLKPYHENCLYLLLARTTGRTPQPAPAVVLTPVQAIAPVYGFSGLGKLARDTGFIDKMQRLFVETVPEQLRQLEAAVAAQRWPEASQLSHALKSTYGLLQIEEALRYILKIEELLKKNPDVKIIEQLLSPLRLITTQMVEAFEE